MKTIRSRFKALAALALLSFPLAAAQAASFYYTALLDGPSESPPNASPGTGFAEVIYDDSLHTLQLDITFSGLLGTTTASHIHAPTSSSGTGTAGVATTTPYFAGFPLGVTSGAYLSTLDLTLASSFSSGYLAANGGTPAGAEATLAAALASDKAYLNIHTSVFQGGEIRGFLVAVPEPSSLALLGLGALVFARSPRFKARVASGGAR